MFAGGQSFSLHFLFFLHQQVNIYYDRRSEEVQIVFVNDAGAAVADSVGFRQVANVS